jgi:hypothetical protein
MLLIRPDAAHRVTVFGSTLKSAATSPGVSRRSLLPSIAPTPWVKGLSPSVAETRELSHKQQLYPSIRKIPYARGRRATARAVRGSEPAAGCTSLQPGAVLYSQGVMRATLSYTLLRILIFFAVALILALFGVHGLTLIAVALIISAIISLLLLSRLRDRMSASLANRLGRFHAGLEEASRREDTD